MTGEFTGPSDPEAALFEVGELEPMRVWHGLAVAVDQVPSEHYTGAVRTIWRQFYVRAADFRDARDTLSLRVPELFVEQVPERTVMHPSKPDHEGQILLDYQHPGADCVEVEYIPPQGDDLVIF